MAFPSTHPTPKSLTALGVAVGALASMLLGTATPAWACASCGCTLSSDWQAQGLSPEPGFRFDLRYDYLNQRELSSGTGTVNRDALSYPQDREIERYTRNNYVTAALDYSQADWGVNVQLPYVSRGHGTTAEGDTDPSFSHGSGLGDIRVMGRYHGWSSDGATTGLQAGLKLPTGAFHETFSSGAEVGTPLDRGLQPGTGTTDFLIGAYRFGALGLDWAYFLQAQAQIPMTEREQYQPGVSLSVSGGISYTALTWITPQVQINFRTAAPDIGDQADRPNSGGQLVYLSPGASIPLGRQISVYGYVQVPVFQDVRGYQLTPHWTASAGVRYQF
jgi:hypothetical protein